MKSNTKAESAKKNYNKPELVKYGALNEVTKLYNGGCGKPGSSDYCKG